MIQETPVIYGSYNARQLSVDKIVNTFIPPKQFASLTANTHNFLLGARGSGKTTLLKMLSIEALDLMQKSERFKNRYQIDFIGVYIPANAVWGSILTKLSKQNQSIDQPNWPRLMADAAFTTGVLMSITETLHFCTANQNEEYIQFSKKQFKEIIKALSAQWKLSPESYSFLSLKHALSRRLIEIQQFSNLLINDFYDRHELEAQGKKMSYLGFPFLSMATNALNTINEISRDTERTWALLFDEFEIAPESLCKDLLKVIRGSSENIIYKVAFAPCGNLSLMDTHGTSYPQSMHDYNPVELWDSAKSGHKVFCEELCQMQLNKYDQFKNKTPHDVFGSSSYWADNNMKEEEVQRKTNNWKQNFRDLAEIDPKFKEFLNKSYPDIEYRTTDESRIRKIMPQVAFRWAYRRSWRKPFLDPYSGWEVISAVCEGNPRWLLGITNDIINSFLATKQKGYNIPHDIQQKEVLKASEKFGDILKVTTTTQANELTSEHQVYSLLSKIGAYFHDQLVSQEKFNEHPQGSFKIDDNIGIKDEKSLKTAMNLGAIICYDKTHSLQEYTSLKGKQFRLSYLLSPTFKLMTRKGRSVSLSTILKKTAPNAFSKKQASLSLQQDLLNFNL